MGGQEDGNGFIDADRLIKIIKEEFEMTIDIEKLIQDIDEDGSGEIEYDEFRNLLSSSDWAITIFCISIDKDTCSISLQAAWMQQLLIQATFLHRCSLL